MRSATASPILESMTRQSSNGVAPVVFRLDVDNTLLDNDQAERDYRRVLERQCGPAAAAQYWRFFEALRQELGYADYLGALQRYRLEDMHDPRLIVVATYLLDYPFADRLYPRALEVVRHLGARGTTVLLTDGDVHSGAALPRRRASARIAAPNRSSTRMAARSFGAPCVMARSTPS